MLQLKRYEHFHLNTSIRENDAQQTLVTFLYQWLDNVKINKYATFDPNRTWGSRVMSRPK